MEKIKVNEEQCIGCGACQAVCPEVFEVEDVAHTELHGDQVRSFDKVNDVAALAVGFGIKGLALRARKRALIPEILQHVFIIPVVEPGIRVIIFNADQIQRHGGGHAGERTRPVGGIVVLGGSHVIGRDAADSLGDLIRHAALHVADAVVAVLAFAVRQILAVGAHVEAVRAAAAGDGVADGEVAALFAVLVYGLLGGRQRRAAARQDHQQSQHDGKGTFDALFHSDTSNCVSFCGEKGCAIFQCGKGRTPFSHRYPESERA